MDRDHAAIAFDGEVVRVLPSGRRRVKLVNGHHVTVLPVRGDASPQPPEVGQAVVVEIGFNQLKGWRLARRP